MPTAASTPACAGPDFDDRARPMPAALLNCPAPAKLNLLLHVTGRRADGYHLLETVFQFIDLQDRLHFNPRSDGQIVRVDPPGVAAPAWPAEADLSIRAARLLRQAAGTTAHTAIGVSITIEKRIPDGGGLGGGSSDAATTLLALNEFWKLGWTREQLAQLAVQLGADVPVFVRGKNAYARGIGEQLEPIALPARRFVLVIPAVAVATAAVFGDANLTRNTKPITLVGFAHEQSLVPSGLPGRNDLESTVTQRFPAVANALSALLNAATKHGVNASAVRMTGSGACVFAAIDDPSIADDVAVAVEGAQVGRVLICRALAEHPMAVVGVQ